MALAIHLLGKPRIERDGVAADPPKGRKSWALLAYLLCSSGPVPRERLGALLFCDADDPLGSLRWNLAELRRVLGDPQVLRGDPLQLSLPPGSFLDVRALESGTWMEALEVPDLGRDLLGGMDFPSSPAFEAWLLNERRRVATSAHAVLRQATLARLAAGQAEAAIDLAARLVALDPLVEEHQALLIRSYAVAGDAVAASRQLAACVELFRRELGVDPGRDVLLAVHASPILSTSRPASGAAAARAQLEAGEAALDAGMLEPGLECLRRAILEAHQSRDDHVMARALFVLGSALAHAGGHRRQQAATALHEVITLGEREGEPVVAAAAYRELAWLELMAARYGRAQQLLSHAASLAGPDPTERAAIRLLLGMCLTDVGRYGESIEVLEEAVELAEQGGSGKRLVYSLSWLGRARLLRGELGVARRTLERAMTLVRSQGWVWVSALPEAFLGEIEIREGNLAAAGRALEHAFAMACQVGDPCFESLSARGLGLLEAARGDVDAAVARLKQARMRLVTIPDYTWSTAYALDALCSVAVEHEMEAAANWASDLESLGGRTGMREFVARAYLHRARLGDEGALEAAKLIATEIDNPALHELLTSPIHRSSEASAIVGRASG
jgi:DNA-binding SARP family transcriptional activator